MQNEQYMQWLSGAAAHAGKSASDIERILTGSGVPGADAEAIAQGVVSAHEVTANKMRFEAHIEASRLDDHAVWNSATLAAFSRRRSRLFALRLVGLVIVAIMLILGYTIYRSHAPQQKDQLIPVAGQNVQSGTDSEPKHARLQNAHKAPKHESARHTPRYRAEEKGPRDGLSQQDEDASVPTRTAVATSDDHPEACPPSVDRLGCPGSSAPSSLVPFVRVPTNAHSEQGGFGWQCDRGYVQRGNACILISVPAHAHLDVSGHAWNCDDGFAGDNGGCIAQ